MVKEPICSVNVVVVVATVVGLEPVLDVGSEDVVITLVPWSEAIVEVSLAGSPVVSTAIPSTSSVVVVVLVVVGDVVDAVDVVDVVVVVVITVILVILVNVVVTVTVDVVNLAAVVPASGRSTDVVIAT